MSVYATAADVRAEPEVPSTSPPTDADLEQIIVTAEDRIDEWLGPWPVQETGASVGRKIAQTDVEAWRWLKLKRATVRLAVQLYVDPGVLRPAGWTSVSGPDFSTSGPARPVSRIGDVTAALNASGLRILSARI